YPNINNSPLANAALFFYDGKSFKREQFPPNKDKHSAKDSIDLQINNLPMEYMQYKMEYHFPKPVKETSLGDFVSFSDDRKTMYLDVSENELRENSDNFNFEVVFE